MAQNDWLLANINNPEFDTEDLRSVGGLTLENTQFLQRDEYKEKPKIQELFSDENGNFDEEKFDNYYNYQIAKWNDFIDNEAVDNYEYSIWDTDIVSRPNPKINVPEFSFVNIPNPDKISIGIEGMNVVGEKKWSMSELAQKSNIVDSRTGEDLGYTPNDINLFKNPIEYFKSIFDEPLVLAQYDADEIDADGNIHKKGEIKLNDKGEYYYETLGDRSLAGKKVLSALDMITVDGSALNKIDVFDSDGIEKSVTGTVVKNALAVAPLMFLGPVGSFIYGGMYVAKELAKALPMLYGMTAIFGNEDVNSNSLNLLAGIGYKLSSGTSEYSQLHVLTFENFGNLVADVALQWGQQRMIANSVYKLTTLKGDPIVRAQGKALNKYGTVVEEMIEKMTSGGMEPQKILQYAGMKSFNPNELRAVMESGAWANSHLGKACLQEVMPLAQKIAARKARLGLDLSLMYMSIVSNTDVYQSALEAGATKKEAAGLALGSMIGMFLVDKYLHLGELFFDDNAVEAKRARLAYRKRMEQDAASSVKHLHDTHNNSELGIKLVSSETKEAEKKTLSRWISTGISNIKKIPGEYWEGLKYNTLGFSGKALGEGIEEVSEEAVTDLMKSLFEVAHDFGYTSLDDYGAWDNAGARYGMSFLGGATGGALFYGVDLYKNPKTYDQKKAVQSLEYYVSNKKTKDLLKELDNLHKKGKLGSTTLSVDTTNPDDKGNVTFLSASKDHISQNDYIYNLLKSNILSLDQTLNQYGLNLTDNELFDLMVQQEARYVELKDYLGEAAYLTGYHDLFRILTHKIVTTLKQKDAAAKTKDGIYKESMTDADVVPDGYKRTEAEQASYNASMQAYDEQLDKLFAERDAFKNGLFSPYYTSMMLWAIDSGLSGPFLAMNINQYARRVTGRSYDELSEAQKAKVKERWETYKNSGGLQTDVRESYSKFEDLSRRLEPMIIGMSETDVTEWDEVLKIIDEFSLENQQLNYDSRIQDLENPDDTRYNESEDEYNNRSKKLEGETDEQFIARRQARINKIQLYNETHAIKYLENLIEHAPFIDVATRRKLAAQIGKRRKDSITERAEMQLEYYRRLKADKDFAAAEGIDPETLGNLRHFELLVESLREIKSDLSNKDEVKELFKQRIKAELEREIREPLDGHEMNSTLLQQVSDYLINYLGIDVEGVLTRDDVFDFFDKVYAEFNQATKDTYVKDSEESLNAFKDYLGSSESAELGEGPDKIYGFGLNISGSDESINDPLITDVFNAWRTRNAQQTRLEELENIKDEDMTPELEKERDELRQIWENDENYGYEDSGEIRRAANKVFSSIESELENSFDKVLEQVEQDAWYKALTKLDEKVKSDKNPSVIVLKQIAKELGPGFDDVEQVLNIVFEQFEKADRQSDFRLTPEQQAALEKANQLLAFGKAVIEAASTRKSGTLPNPVGHNAVVNQFVKDHTDLQGEYKELPILDDNIANILIHDFTNYQNEIRTWITRSNDNIVNNNRRLMDTGPALIKGKLSFLKSLSPELMVTAGGRNLFEGIDFTDAESENDLHKIQNQFYINVHAALDAGESFEEVFAFIPKILNVKQALRQQLTPIDDKFGMDKMTDYYKFTYIISIAAVDSTTVMSKIKDNIAAETDLAPLATQEEAFRMALAMSLNPEFVNNGLYLLNKLSGGKLPVLTNSSVVIGIGGAGKTQAEAKQFSKLFEDKTYLIGPTTKQSDTLKQVIPGGTTIDVKTLLINILGETTYTEILNDCNRENKTSDVGKTYSHFKVGLGLDSMPTVELTELTLSENSEPVKAIIFDEITHLPNAFVQVISKWAEQNGLRVLYMGDDVQNGSSNIGGNVNYEQVLAWRTPKLSISLRDANILKINNLNQLMNPISRALSSTDEEEKVATKELQNALSNLQLHAYTSGTLKGDLITKELTSDLIDLISKDGDIAFVGSVESDTYKTLQRAGISVQVFTPKEIQGREFKYVIIDRTDWKIPNKDSKLGELFDFGKDLYTMLSRSKEGTIIIDKTDSLASYLVNRTVIDKTTGTVPKLDVSKFRSNRLAELEKLDLTPITKSEKEPTPEPKPEPKKKVIKPEENKIEKFVDDYQPDDDGSLDFPILSYGSVSLLGVTQEIDGEQKVWINNGLNRDLGIVMKSDDRLVTDREKNSAVDLLFALKSIFLYDALGQYSASKDAYERTVFANLLDILPYDTFKNGVEYYIEVSDNTDDDHIVGETMSSDKLGIANNKKFLVVAKWVAPDGRECTLTLGALSNPETWKKNLPKIKEAITKKIEAGENVEENTAKLANLDRQVINYETRINELAKNDLLIKISKPQFSGFSEIKKLDKPIRLEDIDPKSRRTPFFNLDQHGVYSPLYGIWDELYDESESSEDEVKKGLFSKIKGKTVMFGTANRLLNPNDLIKIYIEEKRKQLAGEDVVPQVRMFVLDNEGVSYQSLYNDSFKELYSADSKSSISYPFELMPMGIRMYISLWNARANIKKFKSALNDWANEKGLTESQVEDLAELDSKFYSECVEESGKSYVNEDDYHEWVRTNKSPDDFSKLSLIWDFNNSLSDKVRQFRLGYNRRSGAYVRKLTGIIEGNPFYSTDYSDAKSKGRQFVESYDKVFGIFISPKFLNQWEKAIDVIFEEVLNKVINPNDFTELQGKEDLWINPYKPDGWFDTKLELKDGKLIFGFEDGNTSEITVLNDQLFKGIPIILTAIGKNFRIFKHNPEFVMNVLQKRDNSPESISEMGSAARGIAIHYNDSDTPIKWENLLSAFEGGIGVINPDEADNEDTLPPGVIKVTYTDIHNEEDGEIEITANEDVRFENMMNLLFHGCIATRRLNDFNSFQNRASDAFFKFGFLIDPIYAKLSERTSKGDCPAPFTPVHSSMKFFSCDAKIGFPRMFINLDELEHPIKTKTPGKPDERPSKKELTKEEIKKNNFIKQVQNKYPSLIIDSSMDIEDIELGLKNAELNMITSLFRTPDIDTLTENFPKCIISHESDEDGNIKVTRLTDLPELKGKEISKLALEGEKIKVTLSDGNSVILTNNDGEISAQTYIASSADDSKKTFGKIMSEIKSKFEKELQGKNIYLLGRNIHDDNGEYEDWDYDEDFEDKGVLYKGDDIKKQIVKFDDLWKTFIEENFKTFNDTSEITDLSTLEKIQLKVKAFKALLNENTLIGIIDGDNRVIHNELELEINSTTCSILKI